MTSNYVIPRTITSPTVNNNSTFLIINSEVHNETYLSGFTLYGAVSGSITIQVRKKDAINKNVIKNINIK